jgi:ABC-2 type transport system ATP-binding protein
MDQEPPVVVTEGLTKRYGEIVAVEDLSIALDRGRILGLIGPNGAGKTTTIRILVGQARPTRGRASIAGADCVRDAKRIKRLVGYMPEVFGSYDNLRVHEYLDFFGAAFGMRPRRRAARIDEVIQITGCGYMRDRYVESLSHGMKQRVGLARTLLHDPEVLILDEPGNGLDPQARIEMRHLLLGLAKAGKTLIVSSHILSELARICDRVAILHRGRLCAFGTHEEILREVNEQRLIEVQLAAGDQIDRAAETVGRQLDEGAELTVSPAEAVLRFRTSRPESGLAELLGSLVAQGIHVSQFREVSSDLEETFLTITQGHAVESGE